MPITHVIKREGKLQPFERERVVNSIFRAAEAAGGKDRQLAEKRATEVIELLEQKFADRPPHVEDVQDAIERVLVERRHYRTAKLFMLYRKRHEELRAARSVVFDAGKLIDDFVSRNDWRSAENANISYSPPALMFHNTGSVTARYCFDEKTRVLTEKGFKHFKDVQPGDKVATLNLENGELEFQHPTSRQVFYYQGHMFHWKMKKGGTDLLVTPEHRMLVRFSPRGKWRFVSAAELARKNRYEFKRSAGWQGISMQLDVSPVGKSRFYKPHLISKYEQAKSLKKSGLGSERIGRILGVAPWTVSAWLYQNHNPNRIGGEPKNLKFPIDDFIELIGWFISEGTLWSDGKSDHRVEIAQEKKKNRKKIEGLLRRLGLTAYAGKSRFRVTSKQLYNYFLRFGKVSKERCIPKDIKSLPPKYLDLILHTLFLGDGNFRNGKMKQYVSKSKRLVEDIAECLVKTGRGAKIFWDRKCWVVGVGNKTQTPEFVGKPAIVPYEGWVYDLTVPSGTLLVEREGYIQWSGNCLDRVYGPEISDSHISGDLHLHDLYNGLNGYCAGWSLQQLLLKGFGGIPGGVRSKPPAHLDTALMQMVNFIGSLQNEWAGAQAFNACDVLLAPFVRADKLDYRQTKQAIQALVFNLNITSRWGGQTPFTNLTFSLSCPEDLAGQPAVVGGKPLDRTYAEYEPEVEMLNRAFIEVLCEGDASGRPFTFPIPTYSLTRDFEWEEGISRELFAMTGKLGLPYFQNFVSSELSPSQARSMCCHLRLDLEELRRNVTGGLFGSADQTGSVGVVTVNMPRLGYLAKDEDEFFERLGYLLMLASRSLEHKRRIVERNIRSGLLPLTKRYLGSLRNHFSTIGLVGMHEALLNFGIEGGICSAEGRDFARRVLTFMRERCAGFQRETGNLYNLEATPAEGTSYRLARIDKRKYPDIRTAGGKIPYYTNSTNLPAAHGLSLVEALEHQEPLQQIYTGGTVFHCFLGEAVMDPGGCELLVRRIAENFRIPYFTITPIFSICPDHGYLTGNRAQCPTCGKKTEVYSRVVGYFRPVRNWNAGKREEFKERSSFDRTLHGVAR